MAEWASGGMSERMFERMFEQMFREISEWLFERISEPFRSGGRWDVFRAPFPVGMRLMYAKNRIHFTHVRSLGPNVYEIFMLIRPNRAQKP
ncbi:hypothetical protein D3C76_1638470 [compost metagenome]